MSGVSESELFRGHNLTHDVEVAPPPQRCACGGWITPLGPTAEAIRLAVQRDQQTLRHQRWQQAREEIET